MEFRTGQRLWTGYWAWLCDMNMETMVRHDVFCVVWDDDDDRITMATAPSV